MYKKYNLKVCIIMGILVCLFAIIADYINVPSMFGMDISRFNHQALDTISDVIVALFIFAISYSLIERWNVKKQQNQRNVAVQLILYTFNLCKKTMELLERPDFIKVLANPENENDPMLNGVGASVQQIGEFPFHSHDQIMQLFIEGVFDCDLVEKYLTIKGIFGTYAYICILDSRTGKREKNLNNMKKQLTGLIEETTKLVEQAGNEIKTEK